MENNDTNFISAMLLFILAHLVDGKFWTIAYAVLAIIFSIFFIANFKGK